MDFEHLIDLAARYNNISADNRARLPSLSVLRRTYPSNIEAYVYEPVICLILQGSKVTSIGDQIVELRAKDALLVSHDLPVTSRITMASVCEPYFAVILTLDLDLLRSLHQVVGDAMVPDSNARSLSVGSAEEAWLAPLIRYFEMMDAPVDAKVLGPSILREIHYRLLLSPIGKMLRNLLVTDSHASRIEKAIHMIRGNFHKALSVAELAGAVSMSASSFHDHFKSVTGTTPLQYQKDLRLIEAKSLLAGKHHSVSEAAFAVGYESPTHFSRDYSRKFGVSPSRDSKASVVITT